MADDGATTPALVAAAQAGDRAALDALLRRHYDRVHAVCRRIAGSSRDADDATQEAMISIVRALDRFDGRVGVLDVDLPDRHQRRARRAAPTQAPTGACTLVRDDEPAPEIVDPLAERRSRASSTRISIDDALDGLPEDFRAAVVLRDVADLDYAEIAEVLQIPVGTVKSRIARGRGQLADALGNQDPGRDVQPEIHRTRTMNDDQRLLASAALDGAVTAEERARAEADPEVVAEIERLRAVRDGAAGRRRHPTPTRREAAIAAALAAFDDGRRRRSPTAVAGRTGGAPGGWPRWPPPPPSPSSPSAASSPCSGGGERRRRLPASTAADRGRARRPPTRASAPATADGRRRGWPTPTRTPAPAADEAPAATTAASARGSRSSPWPADRRRRWTTLRSRRRARRLRPAADATEPRRRATRSAPAARSSARRPTSSDGVAVPVEVFEVDEPHEAVAVDASSDCDVVARARSPDASSDARDDARAGVGPATRVRPCPPTR